MVQDQQDFDQAAAATDSSSSSGWAAAPAASAAERTMPIGGVVTMAGIFLLFLTFALALFLLQYFFSTSVRTAPRRRPRGARGAAAGGIDPELLRSLPITVYRAAAPKGSVEVAGVECAVCLAELEDGEEARFLPRCGHGFHAECVDMWLASHSTCPLCRVTVGKPDASSQALTSTGLPSVPPEPANYAGNLPASVLLGVSDQATVGAVTWSFDGGRSRPSAFALATAAVLVIDIPNSRTVTTPRDAFKSPSSARLGSFKRLWSFGRQGPSGSTPACPGSSGGGGTGAADMERGISITCATPRAPV